MCVRTEIYLIFFGLLNANGSPSCYMPLKAVSPTPLYYPLTIHYAYAALHQSPNCHVPTAKVHDRNNTLDSLNYSPGYHPRSALGLASRGRGRDNQGRKFKLWLELRRLPQILLVLVRHTIN